jgi:hypothetical protein
MSNSEKLSVGLKNREALTGANLKITINPSAYETLDVLVDGYRNNLPPYDESVLPQECKPDSLRPGGEYHGSSKHAMFFWNICSYMQGGVKTDMAFKRMTDIFNKNPDLFDCKSLAEADPVEVSDRLSVYRLGRQHAVADCWVKNAQILIDKYDGDPRNIFNDINTYEDCVERIKNTGNSGFNGFREKMTSMILYFYMNENLISETSFPMPVDFHALRVVLATEMITVEPRDFYIYSHVVEDSLRELFQGYLKNRDVCPLELTNSIWLLSSNLCSKSLGNRPAASKEGSDFRELDVDNLRLSESWRRSCGKCLVERCCRLYIPSGPYYDKGAIRVIEKTT